MAKTLEKQRPSVNMNVSAKRGPSEAEKIFKAMREKIREVFPDDDEASWQWTGEDFATHDIQRPEDDFKTWLTAKYAKSNDFTQRLVRRMFTMWQEMEEQGFQANDLELYEHQKALFAWIAISTANGMRDQMANLLIRSPYGSGKSMVAGLVVRAFREVQAEMAAEGTDHKKLPTGVGLFRRKEHMQQNAMGEQHAVLQPPYTVDRSDVKVYWKSLQKMFGDDFAKHFKCPGGKQHAFFDLFGVNEDDGEEEEVPVARRVKQLIEAMDEPTHSSWMKVHSTKRGQIVKMLGMLAGGEVVLVPDVYNVPQPERPLPREAEQITGKRRYRGDSAHALDESEHYRIKTTHKHLALDRAAYTTQPNMENPAQFCLAYGSMVTRHTEGIRADVREEIMRRARFLAVDEAGSYTPGSLADSMSELSGEWPFVAGFTGQDQGIEGWSGRSPVLSIQQMIRLKLMKPIAFMGIGDARNPPGQGSEEAWTAYRKRMFQPEPTATALGLPQPHQLDSVVIAPSGPALREYAHRIQQAHEEEGIPVKIWCFDPDAGDNRWSIVVNGFNAPKQAGEPRRILVAPPSMMSEALHLRAECYDVLANMNKFAIDQARGRLGHIRNTGNPADQEKARTCFRVQWLEGASGEPYIREVAKAMGYPLADENEDWQPLRCMIDKAAYQKDAKRKGLSEAEPIPDTRAVQLRKRKKQKKTEWTPLKPTSPFVIEKERRRAARAATKSVGVLSANRIEATPVKGDARFSARKGKVAVTISVNGTGMVTNLDEIAQHHKIHSLGGSLISTITDAHRRGVRDQELANATLLEVVRLQGVQARRRGLTVTENTSELEETTAQVDLEYVEPTAEQIAGKK